MLQGWKICAAAWLAVVFLVAPAGAQSALRVGVLDCRSNGATTFIIGSVHEFDCLYRSEEGRAYPYRGVIRRMGLDLGVISDAGLSWIVFAPTRMIGPADLAGNYAGVSAAAAVGVGAGANALVGGSNNAISLQPLSLQGQTGFNVAVGVADFELRYGR
jgi:hypothetical protein